MALSIVVAVKQEDRDASCCEPAHLPDEEKPCLIIAPVSVIEIARDDDEFDLFVESQTHKVFKRLAGRGPDTVSRATILACKAYQRTVEMDVCGVDESKGCQRDPTDRSMLDAKVGKNSALCRNDDRAKQHWERKPIAQSFQEPA